MSEHQSEDQEVANCDDWTKILLHCRECGVAFQRKVKGQRYCEEHRHLSGSVIRPMAAGLPRIAHVNVRLFGRTPTGDWRMEWRQVRVHSLEEALKVAEQMPDVKHIYEASWLPGGCIT